MRQSADEVIKITMELGGKAPFIVFNVATVEGAMISKYHNNGQTCISASRIYVQSEVYDAFVAKLAQTIDKIKVGDGFDAGISAGPLINVAALSKVEAAHQ